MSFASDTTYCYCLFLGVKAGMFVRDAKNLCPHIVIFPYDFEAYEEVTNAFKHSF